MKFENIFSFLGRVERTVLTVGYAFSLYYFYNLEAPLGTKVFCVLLASIFLFILLRQAFKKGKFSGGVQVSVNQDKNRLGELLAFDYSTVKIIAIISFLISAFFVTLISYEVLVNEKSRYIPLKLLAGMFFYLIFKESLRRLGERKL